MNYEKTCKHHGELLPEHIFVEKTKRCKLGYVLKCRLCIRKRSSKRMKDVSESLKMKKGIVND